jgi:hypothetical protein
MVTVCCGLRVSGKVAPDALNPTPRIAAELIVSGAVPVEVSVNGSVVIDPTVTLPKVRLDALIESAAAGGATPGWVAVYPYPGRTKIRQQASIDMSSQWLNL